MPPTNHRRPGRRTYAATADGAPDAGAGSAQAPAQPPLTTTTTTTTTRRRAKPSREFIGVAKGMDVGRFRAYSADGFVKGACLKVVNGPSHAKLES